MAVTELIKSPGNKDDLLDLRQYIRDSRREIILWMFVLFLGQVAATVIMCSLFLV